MIEIIKEMMMLTDAEIAKLEAAMKDWPKLPVTIREHGDEGLVFIESADAKFCWMFDCDAINRRQLEQIRLGLDSLPALVELCESQKEEIEARGKRIEEWKALHGKSNEALILLQDDFLALSKRMHDAGNENEGLRARLARAEEALEKVQLARSGEDAAGIATAYFASYAALERVREAAEKLAHWVDGYDAWNDASPDTSELKAALDAAKGEVK